MPQDAFTNYIPFLNYGMNLMEEMSEKQEEWKERIRQEYIESRKYPRKKKKQIRKKLQVEWSIACYDLFGDLFQ